MPLNSVSFLCAMGFREDVICHNKSEFRTSLLHSHDPILSPSPSLFHFLTLSLSPPLLPRTPPGDVRCTKTIHFMCSSRICKLPYSIHFEFVVFHCATKLWVEMFVCLRHNGAEWSRKSSRKSVVSLRIIENRNRIFVTSSIM